MGVRVPRAHAEIPGLRLRKALRRVPSRACGSPAPPRRTARGERPPPRFGTRFRSPPYRHTGFPPRRRSDTSHGDRKPCISPPRLPSTKFAGSSPGSPCPRTDPHRGRTRAPRRRSLRSCKMRSRFHRARSDTRAHPGRIRRTGSPSRQTPDSESPPPASRTGPIPLPSTKSAGPFPSSPCPRTDPPSRPPQDTIRSPHPAPRSPRRAARASPVHRQ